MSRFLDLVNRAASLCLLACVLVASPTFAQAPAPLAPSGAMFRSSDERVVMRLDFTGAEGCADPQVLRDAVGAKVRAWDPFGPNAPWRLTIIVQRRAPGYEGSAELHDVTGAVTWARRFSPTARCIDMVEDLALAVAFQIDPARLPQAPVVESDRPLPPEKTQKPPLPVATPTRVLLRFGASAWGDLATAPSPAFGLSLDLGFRIAWFSLAGELRWDAPTGATVMTGVDIKTERIVGALVPCGHVGERAAFVGCVLAELGQVEGTITAAGVRAPDHQATLAAALGVRLGVEIPIVPHLYARLAADLLGGLARPRFHLDQPIVWESPAFLGGLGAGLGASF